MDSIENKTFCFDIDGTLCTNSGGDYENAVPFADRIALVNLLAEQGHTIKLFTARGAQSGFDWSSLTARQVESWGLRHHRLLFGKPHADLFIDDKGVEADTFFSAIGPTADLQG